jgi:hypothetical protein
MQRRVERNISQNRDPNHQEKVTKEICSKQKQSSRENVSQREGNQRDYLKKK